MSLTPNQDLMVEGIMSLENEMYVHFRNESFIRLQIFPEILTEKGFQTVTRYMVLSSNQTATTKAPANHRATLKHQFEIPFEHVTLDELLFR